MTTPMPPVAQSASTAWRLLLLKLITQGQPVCSRGLKAYEVVGLQSAIDMRRPLVCQKFRKLSVRFAAAEAHWIISGDNRVSSIASYNRKIADFSDDGFVFFGAYGPQVIDQLSYVANSIAGDPDTRQAVLTIWRQNPRASKDIPCTVAIQWLLRNNALHCIDTMRSSDAWLGWPYDVFNFSMLTWYLKLILEAHHNFKVDVGTLTLNAGSQHLYDSNLKQAMNVYNPSDLHEEPPLSLFLDKLRSPFELLDVLNELRKLTSYEQWHEYLSGA